uniref:Adenosine 5'-monophosphoramidase HINT3 n=1 Tax=Strigamia maritima TaxID=126957 RepID=T1J8U8_STRMM
MSEHNREQCLFCRIADGKEAATQLLYQDTSFVIFSDIRPAADHHYLVVTKEHLKDAKQLTKEHKPMVQNMVDVGQKFLEEKGGDLDDSRLGFHWPPFHAIAHLHMHVISPASRMKLMGRIIFRPGLWFITFRSVIEWSVGETKTETEMETETETETRSDGARPVAPTTKVELKFGS